MGLRLVPKGDDIRFGLHDTIFIIQCNIIVHNSDLQPREVLGERNHGNQKNTRVSEILQEYGDIADVMEVFGIKRGARYSIRALATKAITVEWAARVHRVPLDEFLAILHKAVASNSEPDQHAKPVEGK